MIYRRAPFGEDSSVDTLDLGHIVFERLRDAGIRSVRELRAASIETLARAGLSEFDIHKCRVALARTRPSPSPGPRSAA